MMSTSRASGRSDQSHFETALDLLSIAGSELVENGLTDALRPIILRLRSEADWAGNSTVGQLFRRTHVTLALSVAESERALASVIELSRCGMDMTWEHDPAFYNFCRSRLHAYADLGDKRRFSRMWSLALCIAVRRGDMQFQGLGLLEYAASRHELLQTDLIARALSAAADYLGLPKPVLDGRSIDLERYLDETMQKLRSM